MGVPLSVLQRRNPRLREAEELTSSHTDNESKTWMTKCEILSYLLNLCLVPRAAKRVTHRPGELCMTYGLGCRFDGVLGSGWIEPDAIWGLGRMAEWKIDVGGDDPKAFVKVVHMFCPGTPAWGGERFWVLLPLCSWGQASEGLWVPWGWVPFSHLQQRNRMGSNPVSAHFPSTWPVLRHHQEHAVTRGGNEEGWKGNGDPFFSNWSSKEGRNKTKYFGKKNQRQLDVFKDYKPTE